MNRERVFSIIGIILGIALIVVGIVFIASPPRSWSTGSVMSYAFGADFYTEQYEATRVAAQNAAVTANNIRDLGRSIASYAGVAFIFAGLLVCLSYAKKIVCCSTGMREPGVLNSQIEKAAEMASAVDEALKNEPAPELPSSLESVDQPSAEASADIQAVEDSIQGKDV